MDGQIKYALYYEADGDDMLDAYYFSSTQVKVGDVIKLETGDFHHVRKVEEKKSGPWLSLAKSAQTAAEAPHMPPYPGER